MTPRRTGAAIVALTVTLAGGAAAFSFMLWRTQDPYRDLPLQVPGLDGVAPSAGPAPEAKKVTIGESFSATGAEPSDLPGSWPSFRGPNRDNISPEETRLADRWRWGGPRVLWSVDLGEGHAGAAVHRGRVYVLDYDERRREDALRCLSLETGRELWRRSYRVDIKMNHGISRTVPAVSDRLVVSIGPRCHVMAVGAEDGAFKWGLDLERDFGAATPLWYTAQCPLLDGTTAVLAPCGKDALLMGVDGESGRILWTTPNPKGWKMSHSSVVPLTLGGTRMYVYSALGGVVAVSAGKEDAGRVLWETSEWTGQVLAPSPVPVDGDRIFLTAGYTAGSALLRVTREDSGFAARILRRLATREGLACEQQTPIHFRGHLFSILPKDAGARKQEFVCVNADDPGKIVWSSGKSRRFGLGPFLMADGKFYLLNDDGMLTMARVSLERYEELDEAKVLDGPDAWGPIALAGGRMILRDSRRMICLDVREP